MNIQRLAFSMTWGIEHSPNGDYCHYQSADAYVTQLCEGFDRERQLYQSQIDTLTALLKRPS